MLFNIQRNVGLTTISEILLSCFLLVCLFPLKASAQYEFILKVNHNELPVFRAMKKKLDNSLVRDKYLIKIIKKKFVKYKMSCFKFKVTISRKEYTDMLKKRYISCLLNLSKKQIEKGIYEINLKFKKKIKFNDVLDCLIYKN